MSDFFEIATRSTKRGTLEIYPKFKAVTSKDLMIRGGDFYAVWLEDEGLWSTNEEKALQLIDRELDTFAKEYRSSFEGSVRVLHLWDVETGMIDRWHRYCRNQLWDSYHTLDDRLTFANTEVKKEDYSSKRLPYPLVKGKHDAYDRLMSVLYEPQEREKLEWAIGAVVAGDSAVIQKFLVLYGAPGTGKSTVLNIIQKLFDGYFAVFDAKALGSSNNSFALEPFNSNPLVAIQHDGDLSRIEDNTRLNSIASHEQMTVNEKFKSAYSNSFKCVMFMGTNKPVRITDAKSGIIRRLIDVQPSGNKLSSSEYKRVVSQINFELGAIAYYCREVYLSNPERYDNYMPTNMMGASNDFYNFVEESYMIFKRDNRVTLKSAWELYKNYCDEAKVSYPLSQRPFKEELKNYFKDFKERTLLDDGTRVRNLYEGFRNDIFEDQVEDSLTSESADDSNWLSLQPIPSLLDAILADSPAQYADEDGKPFRKWKNVKTTLKDIDTSKLHYVQIPDVSHIVFDFDEKDENGEKSLQKNLAEASKWPPTYAELSKSGEGVHLHYIYQGDVSRVRNLFADNIEIKIFTGNSSLRRKVTLCNNLPVATISSGLPIKGDTKKVVTEEHVKNEKNLIRLLIRIMNKEFHPGTKPSVDFIKKVLDDAYESGISYDVTKMRNDIAQFAAHSTHQAEYCMRVVSEMKFKSKETDENVVPEDDTLIFFDIEVFKNLLLVCWKKHGEKSPIVRMFNPSPVEIEELSRRRLIGFNCRRYDNHILYARMMGYSIEACYELSQSIINNGVGFFSDAYNFSYTDVYDFAAAGNKKSLKKYEIQLKIPHIESDDPWDEPLAEERWDKIAEYCSNDVRATEKVFDFLSSDWTARMILADIAGMTVNDTTNSLTKRIIFHGDNEPQDRFIYRFLAEPVTSVRADVAAFLTQACPEMMSAPFGKANSVLPYWEGYEFRNNKSTYRGEVVGEGGYAYSKPGTYGNVVYLDVASMHPHSAIAECLFGPTYTTRFRELVLARIAIKEENWPEAETLLNGLLVPYIEKVKKGLITSKQLANALKTAINSVYGLTAAKFKNQFRDDRNIDNIVAKRGALFMIDLKHEVEDRGFIVVHIKTDSIKIADATPEIIQFVVDYGKRYGYSFDIEDRYDRMCIVDKSSYVAKRPDGSWTVVGDKFAQPYVFKTLFSHEPIVFDDYCVTNAVQTAMYLDMNEGLPDVTSSEKQFEKLEDKYKKGELSDITFESLCDSVRKEVGKGHNYVFVGKVGQFCPIAPGKGGGILVSKNGHKFYAVQGSKGYRWLESDDVHDSGREADIDMNYFNTAVDDCMYDLAVHGDVNWFLSDEPYIPPEYINGAPVYTEFLPWKE